MRNETAKIQKKVKGALSDNVLFYPLHPSPFTIF